MKTRIYNTSLSKSNTCNVIIEERFDNMAISMGLFVVVDRRGQRIEDIEVSSESTANYLFNQFVNRY